VRGSSRAARGQSPTRATSASAFGTAIESRARYRPARYRPLQQSPSLVSLPSANSVALGYGAFIIPVDGGARLFSPLGLSELGISGADILSLLGLPHFLRQGRASAQRRPDKGLPDLGVLGQQVTIGGVDNGGALTFGQLPLIALALVLLSSLLLVGAVLPPGVVARTPVSPAQYEGVRQPLALAAIGILLPVAVVALTIALS
jgi:hypothetical protein